MASAPDLPRSDLVAWLRSALAAPPERVPVGTNRASAVLVPVVERAGGPTVLFVRRSARVSKHAGQIGFPGGAVEPDDASVAAAALREAWEEIGLEPERVELIAPLDEDRTFVSDFHISPVVGYVARPPNAWRLDPYEVDAVLEIGLQEIVAAEPTGWLEFTFGDTLFRAPSFEFRDRTIVWGASARILMHLQRRLRAALP